MKLKVEINRTRVSVPRQVTKIYRVAPFGVPSGVAESLFTQEGQIFISLGSGRAAVLDPPTSGSGQRLEYDPAVSGKIKWSGGGDVEPLTLTNKSGSDQVVGTVVVQDTSNDSAFDTTTTEGDAVIGVLDEGINNDANGAVAQIGLKTVLVQGNVSVGDYLISSTTAGRAKSNGSDPTNAFARATTAYSGGGAGSVTAILFPIPRMAPIESTAYRPSGLWERKSGDNSVIQSPDDGIIVINGKTYTWNSQTELDVDTSGDWDTTSPTDYSTAANRAGMDFYVYAVEPASGSTPDFVLSANSTVPDGETADTSRKVGGFHCLCVDVGTIAGHDLTGYLQGDILPLSVWDLIHRPIASPEGMVWSEKAGIWVDIYLTSGTGASTASEYNQTISDTRTWLDFIDDYAAVDKQLLTDLQFQIIAAGSNEETNISGGADPGTTGGHSDTAGRRMISNIGCEDCAGAMWQWLETPSARLDDGTTAGWYNLPGSAGGFYTYGSNSYGNTQLLAGGGWGNGANCGSRSRTAIGYRWRAGSTLGGRGRSEPRPHRFS